MPVIASQLAWILKEKALCTQEQSNVVKDKLTGFDTERQFGIVLIENSRHPPLIIEMPKLPEHLLIGFYRQAVLNFRTDIAKTLIESMFRWLIHHHHHQASRPQDQVMVLEENDDRVEIYSYALLYLISEALLTHKPTFIVIRPTFKSFRDVYTYCLTENQEWVHQISV